MQTMACLLSLLLLLGALALTDASACMSEIQCVDFSYPNCIIACNLCYTVTITTPQLAWDNDDASANIDDLDPSLGIYEVTYHYKEDLEDVITSFSWENGAETEVTDCVATANGEDCASCTLCSDGSLSADFTNLEKGRRVACGESPGCDIIEMMCYDDVKLFFPFRKTFMRGS
jgi:hypothetical protein